MKKIGTLKPGDKDVEYYSATIRRVSGYWFYECDAEGRFVYDFYHDCDDLIGKPTISEEEAYKRYCEVFDPKNFWDLYS